MTAAAPMAESRTAAHAPAMILTAGIQPPAIRTAYTPDVNPPCPLPLRARPRAVLPCLAAALALAASPAFAQETVVPKRNLRTGYAQVLRVEPVYQTLTATRMEQRCNGEAVPPADKPHGLSRIVGAVKDAFAGDDKPAAAPAQPAPAVAPDAAAGQDCELVPVERQFRRPIAYDVDYVFRGMKYRSRLPYDPGNRLRVQVSVQPVVPDAAP